MTYWALGCVQKCNLWAWLRKEEKGQKLSCVKLAICPDHPRRHRPLKFCVRGRVREVVIYFKFHENRSRGLRAVGVENRPLPLTRLVAYTTACTTVQAVIQLALPTFSTLMHKCFPLKSENLGKCFSEHSVPVLARTFWGHGPVAAS